MYSVKKLTFIVIMLIIIIQLSEVITAVSVVNNMVKNPIGISGRKARPSDYVDNFFFLTMTWINKGYLNTSYFYDVKYVEPWYVIDARTLFFEKIVNEINTDPYKHAEWFDLYSFIMNKEPMSQDGLNKIITKYLSSIDSRTMIVMYGHGLHAGKNDLYVYLGADKGVVPLKGGVTSEKWAKYLSDHMDSPEVYTYYGDANTIIDPQLEEQIIYYAKDYLNKYLGPLYKDYLEKYIVKIDVIKGYEDSNLQTYAVDFYLDRSMFRDSLIEVFVYRCKNTETIFGEGAVIGLSIPDELLNTYIDFAKENYINKTLSQNADILRQYGLKIILNSNKYVPSDKYVVVFEDVDYEILFNNTPIRISPYDIDMPSMGFTLIFSSSGSNNYLHLDLYTGYELLIQALKRKYSVKEWNIGYDELAEILEDYNISIENTTILKYYVINHNAIRPLYYVIHTVKIEHPECCLCLNTTYQNITLVIYADNGEIVFLSKPQLYPFLNDNIDINTSAPLREDIDKTNVETIDNNASMTTTSQRSYNKTTHNSSIGDLSKGDNTWVIEASLITLITVIIALGITYTVRAKRF